MAILDELLRATEMEVPANCGPEFWEKLVRALANEDVVSLARWESLSEAAQDWAIAGVRALKERKKKARDGQAWTGELADLEFEYLPLPEPPAPEPEPEPEPEPAGLADLEDLGLRPESESESEFESESESESGCGGGAGGPTSEDDGAAPPDSPASVVPVEGTTPVPKRKRVGKKAGKKATKKTTKKAAKKAAKGAVAEGAASAAGARVSSLKGKKKKRRAASYKSGSCYWLARWVLGNIKNMQELEPESILERFHAEHPTITIPRGTANTTVYNTISVLRALRDTGRYAHPMMKDFLKVTDTAPNATPKP